MTPEGSSQGHLRISHRDRDSHFHLQKRQGAIVGPVQKSCVLSVGMDWFGLIKVPSSAAASYLPRYNMDHDIAVPWQFGSLENPIKRGGLGSLRVNFIVFL